MHGLILGVLISSSPLFCHGQESGVERTLISPDNAEIYGAYFAAVERRHERPGDTPEHVDLSPDKCIETRHIGVLYYDIQYMYEALEDAPDNEDVEDCSGRPVDPDASCNQLIMFYGGEVCRAVWYRRMTGVTFGERLQVTIRLVLVHLPGPYLPYLECALDGVLYGWMVSDYVCYNHLPDTSLTPLVPVIFHDYITLIHNAEHYDFQRIKGHTEAKQSLKLCQDDQVEQAEKEGSCPILIFNPIEADTWATRYYREINEVGIRSLLLVVAPPADQYDVHTDENWGVCQYVHSGLGNIACSYVFN